MSRGKIGLVDNLVDQQSGEGRPVEGTRMEARRREERVHRVYPT